MYENGDPRHIPNLPDVFLFKKKKSVMIEIGYIYVSTLLDMVPKHVVRDSACFCEGVLIGPTFKSMDVE